MYGDLVSVIIPVYNAELFLENCLKSVTNQTYKNLEIIAVNDGSKDKSLEILKKFRKIKIYTKNNGGSSSARNFGIKFAKGKYIVFVDSDDFIEKDYIETLISSTKNEENDIVVTNYLINGEPENDNWVFLETNDKAKMFSLLLNRKIHNRIMNKIYPLKMVQEIPFPEGSDIMEDAFFTSRILEKCGRLVCLPYSGYHYVFNSSSLSNKKLSEKQIAGKYSNLLERDVIISNYVNTQQDIELNVSKSIEHVKKAIIQNNNLYEFDLYQRIRLVLLAVKKQSKSNKDIKFSNYLLKSLNGYDLKRRLTKYSLFHGSLKERLKSFKKVLLNRY